LEKFLGNINFLLKLAVSFFLLGFALWYQSLAYNLTLILILLGVLVREKIVLFRFAKQKISIAFLLLMIFIFQSFNGYGKIVLQLPLLNLNVTDQGIKTASIFVTQIILIFLVFGLTIYSAKEEEILYYFQRIKHSHIFFVNRISKLFHIGLFVLCLLPKSIGAQQVASAGVKTELDKNKMKLRQKIALLSEGIYAFFSGILKSAEQEYPDFVKNSAKALNFSPVPIYGIHGIIVLVTIFVSHGFLLWY
jgi:hypothetical protein